MRNVYVAAVSFVWPLLLAVLIGTGVATLAPRLAFAADAKNLKVLPRDMSKADIKKLMKGIAASLGVECEHCHNTDDFAEDTKKKEIARTMMKMAGDINKNYFKGKNEVGCVTCHNGKEEPKKP
jgi:Photosynthetic reaction centre cytochrome C subunit